MKPVNQKPQFSAYSGYHDGYNEVYEKEKRYYRIGHPHLIGKYEQENQPKYQPESSKSIAVSFSVITQTVDGLHQRAGSRGVLELHGSIWRLRCTAEDALSDISEPVEDIPPRCACGALLRPDVVWFGEPLPSDVVRSATEAASEADAMLVVGTSAVVYPAAALPVMTLDAGGSVVEVNAETTPLSSLANVSITGRAGDVLPRLWARISNPKAL